MNLRKLERTIARLKWLNGDGPKPPASRPTPRERLARHLRNAGFDCESEDIRYLKGYWTHAHQDCLDCWTAICFRDGQRVEITGTNNVTECARLGVIIEKNGPHSDVYGDYVAAAKPKSK